MRASANSDRMLFTVTHVLGAHIVNLPYRRMAFDRCPGVRLSPGNGGNLSRLTIPPGGTGCQPALPGEASFE